MPLLNIGIALLISVVMFIDPRIRKADAEGRANFARVVKAVRLISTAFFAAVSLAVIGIGAGLALDMSRVVGVGLALLIGLLGNFLGKVRPNYLVGVRTPWTLESREVWIKTHRLTGRLMVGASVVMLLACFTVPPAIAFWVNMGLLMLVSIVSILYSFFAYRKQEQGSGSGKQAVKG